MNDASKAFRQDIIIAHNDDGTPVTLTVSGETQDELSARIKQVYEQFGLLSHSNESLIPKRRGGNRSPVPFTQYAENWFTTYKMGTKPTTQVDYKYILSRHLCPAFEHALVSEITTEDIQVFLNSKMEIARSTVNKIMIALDQIFRSAVKDKIITESPVDHERIYNPSKKVQTREALTEDQLRDILNHLHLLNWQDRRMLALLAFTGMRRGEVLGLRWEDIDLKNEVIHVRRNITYPLNAPYVDTPKTKAGIRDIPLDIRLLNHLMPVQATGYVIGGTMPITKSSYIKAMMRIKKRLDLHGATAHIFRHTYATILNSAGVDPKTIQYILGHSDIATTMNRYTHVSQSNLKEAVVKFQHRV